MLESSYGRSSDLLRIPKKILRARHINLFLRSDLNRAPCFSVDANRRPKRYFPFAEGPRNCVGQSLAKVSLVATAATLMASLSFSLADQMGGPEGVRAREQYTLVGFPTLFIQMRLCDCWFKDLALRAEITASQRLLSCRTTALCLYILSV